MARNNRDREESGLPGGDAGRTRGAAGSEDQRESQFTVPQASPERCRDIMTKDPACCLPIDSTAKAAQLMRDHNVGIVPVVRTKQDKDLVGVVTDRDLTLAVVAEGRDPDLTTVESVMSHPPVVCSPDDVYQKVLRTMERLQLRRVPAVDYAGRLVGMVSQADIALRVKDSKQTAGMMREISRPAA